MTVGVIVLAHENFVRVQQVVENWLVHDCPVAIHIDSAVSDATYQSLRDHFANTDQVVFTKRFRCEWGTWGLVSAACSSSADLIDRFADISHVLLTSGSCLPTKPVPELKTFLKSNKDVDFIESVNTLDVRWTVGGLQRERFQFYFPFSWRRQRKYFDWAVKMQRRLPAFMHRHPPNDLEFHLGSQWWCLTRDTLLKILTDERRDEFDRFFRHVWIPDESYFQTMARRHSPKLESRSLTLSKFDYFGRPHMFYDDHLWLLKGSDRFLARKIWPNAEKLYSEFLDQDSKQEPRATSPKKIERIFEDARRRRVSGRPGLYMVSRFPATGNDAITVRPYTVLVGYSDIFSDFKSWLSLQTGARVHGHVFAPHGAEYAEQESHFMGALSDSPWLRDYNAASFLTNFIWNSRGEEQIFFLGPRDSDKAWRVLVSDRNARINVVSGAFFASLSRLDIDFDAAKLKAARLQKREDKFLSLLAQPWVSAQVNITSLSDFLEAPEFQVQDLVDRIAPKSGNRLAALPEFQDLSRLNVFLQRLRNSGINPYLAGNSALDLERYIGTNAQSQD